jgi:hypothetical protein
VFGDQMRTLSTDGKQQADGVASLILAVSLPLSIFPMSTSSYMMSLATYKAALPPVTVGTAGKSPIETPHPCMISTFSPINTSVAARIFNTTKW